MWITNFNTGKMIDLKQYGFDNFKENADLDSTLKPGRIIKDNGRSWIAVTDMGELRTEVTGKYRHSGAPFPVIGDWVLIQPVENGPGLIREILPPRSRVSRNSAGTVTSEQIIASNIDILFIVFGLEGGRQFSQGAVERYVTLGWNSGALPVLVLNKSDLASPEDLAVTLDLAEEAAPGVEIILTSCESGEGFTRLKEFIKEGKTAAFIGPSGVGKSSVINALSGTGKMKTGTIREQEKKGSHTTPPTGN